MDVPLKNKSYCVDWDEPDELDWKWIDVDFLDDDNTNDRATTPAVNVQPSRNVIDEHAGPRCRDELVDSIL